jgi:hypothetical protein
VKRVFLILSAMALVVVATTASGQVSRYVIEDGDGGVSAAKGRVFGQGSTTLSGYRCAANACTRDAPSSASSPQEGLSLSGVRSYVFTADLSTGSFSGTGAFEFYVYADDDDGSGPDEQWYYVQGIDVTPPSGKQRFVTQIKTVSLWPGNYRLAVRANAVATSAAAPILTTSLRACLTETCAP